MDDDNELSAFNRSFVTPLKKNRLLIGSKETLKEFASKLFCVFLARNIAMTKNNQGLSADKKTAGKQNGCISRLHSSNIFHLLSVYYASKYILGYFITACLTYSSVFYCSLIKLTSCK